MDATGKKDQGSQAFETLSQQFRPRFSLMHTVAGPLITVLAVSQPTIDSAASVVKRLL